MPSTVNLMRNFNVIVTAILAVLYIRIGLRRHQIGAIGILSIGLILTGLTAILNPDLVTNYGDNKAWLGILLAVVGTIFSSFQFIFEESLFRKYSVSPLKAVGLMGVYGTVIGSVVLLIFEFIKSDSLEKTSETFHQMGQGTNESRIVIFANLSFVISVSIFNASGLMVTKFGSGLLRTVLITSRSISIWIVELSVGWKSFNWLSLFGLLMVLLGVLAYNYNYLTSPGSWKGDRTLRKAVLCCGAKDPDAVDDDDDET